MISVSGVAKHRNHYTKEKQQQQVIYCLLLQNIYKKHPTQYSKLITICLQVQMKAAKICKLKTIFIATGRHSSLLQKSINGSNAIVVKNQITDIPRYQSSINT